MGRIWWGSNTEYDSKFEERMVVRWNDEKRWEIVWVH